MNVSKSLRYVKPILAYFIVPIIVGLIVRDCYKPRPKLEVLYALTDTKPYRKDAIGKLNLTYELDNKTNHLEVSVRSIGSESVKDLEIDIRSMSGKIFLSPPDIVYDPPMIDRRLLNEPIITPEHIYLQLSELPYGDRSVRGGSVRLYMDSEDYFDKKEVKIDVIGSGRKWPAIEKQVILKTDKSTFWQNLFCETQMPVSGAYAQDKPNVAPTQKKDTPKSRVFLGGYDPVTLTNEIFLILQKKNIIDKNEAEGVKKTVEEIKSGIRFGGVDVLKFDEEVLNILIHKKVMTRAEAESMLERSRNAGGILINGYNVIHLNAEILNALIKRNLISLQEAQATLDNSKAPKSD